MELAARIAGCKGVDGQWDGLWTCRRGTEVLVYNSTGKTVETEIDGKTVSLAPNSIWFNHPGNSK